MLFRSVRARASAYRLLRQAPGTGPVGGSACILQGAKVLATPCAIAVLASQAWRRVFAGEGVARKFGFDAVLGARGAADCTFVLGRETIAPSDGGALGRIEEELFAFLARNAKSPTDWFNIPIERVVELGARVDL